MKHVISCSFVLASLVGSIVAAQTTSRPASAPQVPTRAMVSRGDVRIEVLAQGAGPIIVILPSLGRGVEDYDVVADRLVAQGFRVVRPQPRGVGASVGPLVGLSLHDYAADVAAVIEQQRAGPVVVAGHAMGNFVARMLATDRPDLVRGVVIAAGSAGKVPAGMPVPVVEPWLQEAIVKSGDLSLPDDERLRYLSIAFFAPGHDPRPWLKGWHPAVISPELTAWQTTPVDAWFASGKAPILEMRAEFDLLTPHAFDGVLKGALGDRVTVVVIPNAGHALAPEQPAAMADAIVAFARKLP